MRSALLIAAAAVAAAPAAAPAAAQGTGSGSGSRQTREYVQAAGHSDSFEMLEASTALTQSADPQVRGYAQRMLADHHRTSAALAGATAQDGLDPPPLGLGADQAPLLAALQGVRGPEFDKMYWRHQALGHRSALVTAQDYAANGDDPTVRRTAAAAAPVIAAHLAEAERMASGG